MTAPAHGLWAYLATSPLLGLTLTLPCDIRIAADNARFGCVFTRRGLVPEAGSAFAKALPRRPRPTRTAAGRRGSAGIMSQRQGAAPGCPLPGGNSGAVQRLR